SLLVLELQRHGRPSRVAPGAGRERTAGAGGLREPQRTAAYRSEIGPPARPPRSSGERVGAGMTTSPSPRAGSGPAAAAVAAPLRRARSAASTMIATTTKPVASAHMCSASTYRLTTLRYVGPASTRPM